MEDDFKMRFLLDFNEFLLTELAELEMQLAVKKIKEEILINKIKKLEKEKNNEQNNFTRKCS